MAQSKIEADLREEISRHGAATGDRTYRVALELTTRIEAEPAADRRQARQTLERRVERAQAEVVRTLVGLGVDRWQRLALSNSIVVEATSPQILEISRHPDLRAVRWIRDRQVTSDLS